ncbi:MAG: hypothetical protein EOO16_00405 [Chitinophagaceae bacterium]|nr:MAG: hypothetical protein EOO16_00405 [Chitinophagaceae bacterium]
MLPKLSALLAVVLLASSCSKKSATEDPVPAPVPVPTPTCNISLYTYTRFANGTPVDYPVTRTNGQVTKIQIGQSAWFTFDYSGQRLVRRTRFDNNTVTSYDSLSYNTDGTLKTYHRFASTFAGNNTFYLRRRSELFYTNGRPDSVHSRESEPGYLLETRMRYEFENGNIARAVNLVPGGAGTVQFTYNTTPNLVGNHFFTLPFSLWDDGVDYSTLPFLFNTNNMTSRTAGSQVTNFQYFTNEGRFSRLTMTGATVENTAIAYTCQ